MKRTIQLFIFTITLIMSTTIDISAQTYDQMWQKVEEYDYDEDLPQQVINMSEKIFDKAKKEHNYPQMLRAWKKLTEEKFNIDSDDFMPLIKATENQTGEGSAKYYLPQPKEGTVEAAVFHALLGSAYHEMKDTHSNDFNKDAEEEYTEMAHSHLMRAIADMPMLASTNADEYKVLLDEGKDSYIFDNDMLSALSFFIIDTKELTTKECFDILTQSAAIYKERGNINGYALCQMSCLQLRAKETNDRDFCLSKQEYKQQLEGLLNEIKGKEVYVDVADEYYKQCINGSKWDSTQKLDFIYAIIANYPKSKLTPNFIRLNAEFVF